MVKENLELIKLKFRLSQLEEQLQFYAEKLQSLDLLDIEVDREQVKKHLTYLGYKVKDDNKIYLKFSYHLTDPRQKDDQEVKFTRFSWEKIDKQQSKGRNVYVVANGHKGGFEKEEIKKFVGLLCEWDNISLEKLSHPWQEVNFVAPTFSVFNGESLQSYWLFNEPVKDPEKWQNLQHKLVKLMKGKPLAINQSCSLAGCWWIEPKKKPILIEICQESGQKYDLEELESQL